MKFRHSIPLMVLGASTVLTTGALAQQAEPPARSKVQVAPARPGAVQPGAVQPGAVQSGTAQVQVNEQSMAACIAIENQEEVAIAQYASEKTKNSDVKQFAKMLVDDHQAFLKKLQRFTPEASRDTLASQTNSPQSKIQPAGGAKPQQPGQAIQQTAAKIDAQAGTAVDLIQLHREVAQECLANSKKKMADIDADKFDLCFIGHQIVMHEAMKTKLTVIQRHSSGEFAELLSGGIEATEKHLQQAEKIMEQLTDGHKSDRKSNKNKPTTTETPRDKDDTKSDKE